MEKTDTPKSQCSSDSVSNFLQTTSQVNGVPSAKKESNHSTPETHCASQNCNNKQIDSPVPPRPFTLASNSKSFIIISPSPPCHLSNLPSPTSLILPIPKQPKTLFMQSLAKLQENPVNLETLNQLKNIKPHIFKEAYSVPIKNAEQNTSELSPPNSMTSAPPSYSFVLRQMAARGRPRLMGTFIPSPSFVQHTPPPNYAAAFDIYVDNTIPPPARTYHFGFVSIPVACPECGYNGMTIVTSKITLCTHLCAVILCLFFCWICVPLPYVLRSCKDVYHYCRNCRHFLGMYCPTNQDTNLYS